MRLLGKRTKKILGLGIFGVAATVMLAVIPVHSGSDGYAELSKANTFNPVYIHMNLQDNVPQKGYLGEVTMLTFKGKSIGDDSYVITGEKVGTDAAVVGAPAQNAVNVGATTLDMGGGISYALTGLELQNRSDRDYTMIRYNDSAVASLVTAGDNMASTANPTTVDRGATFVPLVAGVQKPSWNSAMAFKQLKGSYSDLTGA